MKEINEMIKEGEAADPATRNQLGEDYMDMILKTPCIPTKMIADIDVTMHELANPTANESIAFILNMLRSQWVGENEERETGPRVGTVYVFLDEENVLHLDFRTRFTVDSST